MKPPSPFPSRARRRFLVTDFCLQGDLSNWRSGSSWPGGGGDDDDTPARRFNRFNCEFLAESKRERDREMLVLGLVMLVAAWPVAYMLYGVISLLLHAPPGAL